MLNTCRSTFLGSLLLCWPLFLICTDIQAFAGAIEREERVAIVAPDSPPSALQMALDDLREYLQRSLGVTIRLYPTDSHLADIAESVCIVVGTPSDNQFFEQLAQHGMSVPVDELGPEGCRVQSAIIDSKDVLVLTGSTAQGAGYAAYSFLEREVGIGFFIDGDRIPEPSKVVLTELQRVEQPVVPIRGLFFHHVWKSPHANCWRLWNIDRWKTAIDWMRRKRFNTLPLFHDTGEYMWGDVIFQTFPEIPRNDATLSKFAVDPSWRTQLNKQIFAYVRQSGMKVAFNLFYSQVPNYFPNYFPDIKYHPLNMDNVGINADQPECKQIMKKYWGELLNTYGIDDSHLYLVCSYRHERVLGEGFKNKNQPTLDAVSVIKELDPQAQIHIETWCWKYRDEKEKSWESLDANPGLEWRDFDRAIPQDVGVVEWDVRRMHSRDMPKDFKGRPYIQLIHSNMEGWWPPSTLRNHPQWVIDYMNYAIDNGANGLLYFHIQADTHEILADLGAEIGIVGRPDLRTFYQDYARRRFGPESAAVAAESIELFCDAVDFGQNRENSPLEMFLAFAPPGFFNSAEDLLQRCNETGEARKRWLRERLELIQQKKALYGQAALLARSIAPRKLNEPFFQEYLWELDYVAIRIDGIESMYLAHLLADTDPEQAQLRFDRAVDAFLAYKELFRDRPGIRMSELRSLEPDVPYTADFLKDWETRGYWEEADKALAMHIVWERFDYFENLIRGLLPKELQK